MDLVDVLLDVLELVGSTRSRIGYGRSTVVFVASSASRTGHASCMTAPKPSLLGGHADLERYLDEPVELLS